MYMFFYEHMKCRNQARLCLANYDFEAHIMLSLCLDFEAHIMLSLCLTFQGTGLPAWKKFNSNAVALECFF